MNESNQQNLDELFDSLTPYEVAVLAFTSSKTVKLKEDEESLITLTGKDSYLWAGAIAHAIVRNPELSTETIATMVKKALLSVHEYQRKRAEFHVISFHRIGSSDFRPIDDFLGQAGIVGERDLVFRRTRDAVSSLVWRGYIEDPFKKKVGAAVLCAFLTLPVSFTSTGQNDFQLNALTWEYAQRSENNRIHRQFRVKAKEVSDVVLNDIVPAVVDAVGKLSDPSDAVSMPVKEVQRKLAKLDYYKGPIDGIIGPKTITALRSFQRDRYLDITGYPDPDTIEQLKKK